MPIVTCDYWQSPSGDIHPFRERPEFYAVAESSYDRFRSDRLSRSPDPNDWLPLKAEIQRGTWPAGEGARSHRYRQLEG